MTMFGCARLSFALTVGLAGVALQGAQKEILLKLSGQQPSGSFSSVDAVSGIVLNGVFNPATLPDGSQAVFAFWNACLPPPPPPPGEPPPFPPPPPICPVTAAGMLPAAAVKVQAGGGSVEVDFDTARMILVFASSGPSRWKGTFTRTTGLFSFSQQTTGTQTSTSVFPGFPDPTVTWTYVQKTIGNREQSTANFVGTVGLHPAVPTPGISNGVMFVHSGGTAIILMTER